MKALVTGSAGFVGRHMVRRLRADGWQVALCDINESDPDGRYDALTLFNGGRPESGQYFDLVVHCAYWVGGRKGIDSQPSYLTRNLLLDSAMFDWAQRTNQGAIMYFSSSAAYPTRHQGAANWRKLQEDMIDLQEVEQPDARYGWAKLTGEQLAEAAKLNGQRVHILRPFSGYGEDQGLEYPFPAIVKRVLSGDMSVWGPPGQRRDWIHIDDVVGAALAVYQANHTDPINLCTGIGTEMGQLARKVARCGGVPEREVLYRENMPTGVMARIGDPRRMLDFYQPRISVIDGIELAVKYVRGRS